ncbi:MAG: hypothetical protein JSW34_11130 [Candidatus Zixiibacteriota bacterium]|nr:MAG: hypothetical protein JSW34_11130 [candidate division Zixibacteria bacterium]
MTKRPKIVTNEGPPDKRVSIMAYITKRPDSTYPAVIKPYKLDLTQFGEKVRDEVTFRITNVSDQDLDVSMVAYDGDYFEVELPGTISPGEWGEAKLKLVEEALDKEFEKSFTICVGDELNTRFTVPVKRKLRPSLQQADSDAGAGDKDAP